MPHRRIHPTDGFYHVVVVLVKIFPMPDGFITKNPIAQVSNPIQAP
jgi:hypothetical protein